MKQCKPYENRTFFHKIRANLNQITTLGSRSSLCVMRDMSCMSCVIFPLFQVLDVVKLGQIALQVCCLGILV